MDRRGYSRFKVAGVRTCLYVDGAKDEINASIHDISEMGIGIFIPLYELKKINLSIGDELTFVFCDTVQIGSSGQQYVIVGDCSIKHIDDTEHGIIVGGRISNKDYREYYLRKELALTHGMMYAG